MTTPKTDTPRTPKWHEDFSPEELAEIEAEFPMAERPSGATIAIFIPNPKPSV